VRTGLLPGGVGVHRDRLVAQAGLHTRGQRRGLLLRDARVGMPTMEDTGHHELGAYRDQDLQRKGHAREEEADWSVEGLIQGQVVVPDMLPGVAELTEEEAPTQASDLGDE
jgi:hypothetical protein